MMNFNGMPQMDMNQMGQMNMNQMGQMDMNQMNMMNNPMNQMNNPMNNSMNQMNMMNNPMNQMNNQMNMMNNQMNMMNNPMNQMNNQMQLNPQMNDFNNQVQMNQLNQMQMQMQMQNLANNFMANMIVMGNQMNNMNQNPNNFSQQGGNSNSLSLKFVIDDGKNSIIIIPCLFTDKMGDVIDRFWTKIGGKRDDKAKFIHNAKNISPSLTVAECGLINQNQIQVLLTGRVQGVNFRYTSMTQATKLGLTGWVRNDDDGSVEMEVQGTEELIDELFEIMKTVSEYIVIDSIDETSISVIPDESEFIIKY